MGICRLCKVSYGLLSLCLTIFILVVLLTGILGVAETDATLDSVSAAQRMYLPFTNWQASHDIYVMDVGGENIVALTDTRKNEVFPAWSPDGNSIAFAERCAGHFGISTMNTDGSNTAKVTRLGPDHSYLDVECQPAWSPDGENLAFCSLRGGALDIWVTSVDGMEMFNLTRGFGANAYPAWSPDGSMIAFTSNRDGKDAIYVMNADGSNPHKVINDTKASYLAPAWSPNGHEIVCMVNHNTKPWEIAVISTDGLELREVTSNDLADCFPVWSPDGEYILFARTAGIWVMKGDGTDQRCLLKAPEESGYRRQIWYTLPRWSPDGKKIVFTKGNSTLPREEEVSWLYLGENGELIAPIQGISPGEDLLLIFPDNSGLSLIHSGPKWSGTYANVSSDGHITLTGQGPKEVNQDEAAQFWPYMDATGKPAPPPYGAVIAKAEQELDMTLPNDVIGSAFLLANGDMLALPIEAEPRLNVLWIRRSGGGLSIGRSGPRMKGQVYATVRADRHIVLASAPDNPCGLWRLIDEEGSPAAIPAGTYVAAPVPGEIVSIYDDWTITAFPNGELRLNGASGGKPYVTALFFDDEGNPYISEIPKDAAKAEAAMSGIIKRAREMVERKNASISAEGVNSVAHRE